MDFFKLGAQPYGNDYISHELIEAYTSLIWTERHLAFDEFELKTFDVEGISEALPEGSLVSHAETREVMIVETHEITEVGDGSDAIQELTVRGRSAKSILAGRWVEAEYQKKRRMRAKYTADMAATILIYNAVANTSGKDVTRGDDDPDTEIEKNDYRWNTKDAIPGVVVTDSVPTGLPLRWWQLEQGELWPQLEKILLDADLGLRCIRPVSPSPGTIVTVRALPLSERGTVDRETVSDVGGLQFNVYSGIDRRATVKFSELQGHIDKPQYLRSIAEHKNALEMMSGSVELKDLYLPGDENKTGWARRVTGFDAGTPELPTEPKKPAELKKNATRQQRQNRADAMDKWIDDHAKWENKRDRIVKDFEDEQLPAARRALKALRRVDMFSGDISTLSPYVYKTHYDLGDTVMLYGRNGEDTPMIVAEYVRTDDANGDRGFPGLVAP